MPHHKTLPFLCALLFSCATNSTSSNVDSFGEVADDDGGEYIEYNNPPAEGFNLEGSDVLAMLLADKCMLAMGGREAWDNTRYISWNFFGRRNHLWDKATGDVRIEDPSNELTVLMNINTREGTVYKSGELLSDSLDHFLQKGYGWWVNDSYWLVMPYKLKDSGVSLLYMGEDTTLAGDAADVVQLSFDSVGLTPQNIYKVWIDTDSKLVTQWEYYPDESTEALFTTPWADYRQHGGILLASNRGDYNLENVFTLDSVPGNVFSQPEVSIASLR